MKNRDWENRNEPGKEQRNEERTHALENNRNGVNKLKEVKREKQVGKVNINKKIYKKG